MTGVQKSNSADALDMLGVEIIDMRKVSYTLLTSLSLSLSCFSILTHTLLLSHLSQTQFIW